MNFKIITRPIWILSLVSLFTDISSEMLYPIMPIYLKSIGFTVVIIGILEGFAEATAGISKGYFGKLSDGMGRRLPFVQLGYLLSSFSKPMMAIFTFPFWIFGARSLDRLGKGIRTGARDAMLSDQSSAENKGKVFGFHRALDTLGAAIGPVVALIYLHFYPAAYKTLFIIAFIPGILGVVLTMLLKDTAGNPKINSNYSFFSFLSYWKKSSIEYKKLVMGLLAFALFNSSDAFLLLIMKEQGISDSGVITVYIFYNLVYAIFSYPMGSLGDKLGFKKTYLLGLFLFCLVYFGVAFNTNTYIFYVLFFMYGIYAASTEGIGKAWISNLSTKEDTATAIGFFASFSSLMAIASSTFTGMLWYNFGPSAAFITTAAGTALVFLYFLFNGKNNAKVQ